MIRWLLEGLGLYVTVVAFSYLVRRHMDLVPRLASVAWLVAGLKHSPAVAGSARMIWNGTCSIHCALSWPVLTFSTTFIGGGAVGVLTWRREDHIAALLIVLLAANWVWWEVFGVKLVGFWTAPVREGYLFLSVATFGVLGPWAAWKALHPEGNAPRNVQRHEAE